MFVSTIRFTLRKEQIRIALELRGAQAANITAEQLAKSILNMMVNCPMRAAGLLPGEVIDIDEFFSS